MKKFTKLLTSCCMLAILLLTYSSLFSQVDDDDPDLPPMARNINKEQYLKSRDNYINSLRGLPNTLPYNARSKAIQDMRDLEIAQRNDHNRLLVAPNWVELGPKPINDGNAGRVSAIAVHPTNENIVYVGCANGGVYRSVNGGTTWTAIFDAANSLAIGALALAPSNPSILFVGTGEAASSQDSYAGIGLYRIDNAETAPVLVGPINPNITFTNTAGTGTFTTTAFGFRSISKIIVSPTDPNIVFVSTASGTAGNPGTGPLNTVPPLGLLGVYRSTNAMAAAGSIAFTKLKVASDGSFDFEQTGNITVSDMVIDPTDPAVLIVAVNGSNTSAGGGGIYRSTRATTTAIFTKTYTFTNASVRCELAAAKSMGSLIVYAASGENSTGKIRRSDDGGQTWVTDLVGADGYCGGQCFYDIAIEVDPVNAARIYIGGSSGNNVVRRSLDSGRSASNNNSGGVHADNHVLKVAPSNTSIVYLGCDGGVYKSTNGGGAYSSINTAGFSATQFQSFALHPIDPKYTIGGTQDNGTIMYRADGTFFKIDGGDGGYTLIDQNATDNSTVTVYHTYFNQVGTQTAFTRFNVTGTGVTSGSTFLGCTNGSTTNNGMACPTNVIFYAPMALGPGNPNTLYFGTQALWRSDDRGATMTLASQTSINGGNPIYTIAVAKTNDNVRIVGFGGGQIFGTASGSTTLVNITPALNPGRICTRVFIDPTNANTAYACYNGYGLTAGRHIFKTTNLNLADAGTTTWNPSGTGLPDVPVNCITADVSNNNILFCGTDIGVFISIDGGANWSSYNTGLPVLPVFDIAVHPATKNLRIATHGRGIWESTENALPISLTSFTATPKKEGKVLLQWFTATENNNKGFDVERATINPSGVSAWKKIGFVNGSGTTTTPKRYEFEDEPIGGRKFLYRLKQIDFDNKFKYSEERQVQLTGFDFALFAAYPNPADKNANIRYQLDYDATVKISLFQTDGKLLKQIINEKKEAGIYQVSVNVSALPAGKYFYSIEAGKLKDTKSLIIQRN